MKFLIDGHNLIGQMPDIRLDDPDDEARLVQHLRHFARSGRHQITVIFDAGSPGETGNLSRGPVKVVFAPTGSSADRLIIRRLPRIRDRQSWLIVTSDRQILSAASERHLRTERSEDFAARLRAHPAESDAADPREPHLSEGEIEMWLRHFKRR